MHSTPLCTIFASASAWQLQGHTTGETAAYRAPDPRVNPIPYRATDPRVNPVPYRTPDARLNPVPYRALDPPVNQTGSTALNLTEL